MVTYRMTGKLRAGLRVHLVQFIHTTLTQDLWSGSLGAAPASLGKEGMWEEQIGCSKVGELEDQGET